MDTAIFVINSYMWLHSFYSKELPQNGETLTGTGYRPSGGGKGVNQAFAAAYEGCQVEVLGRIGDDEPGRVCREECAETGVGTRYLIADQKTATGCGCILRDEKGGNSIVIVPGVSDYFSREDFDAAESYVRLCSVGGFQLEVNFDTVCYAISRSAKLGVRTFLDPAPAVPLPQELYRDIHFIKPNEHEAAILTGIEVNNEKSAKEAGEWFIDRGVKECAVITMGERGCVVVSRDGAYAVPAPAVKVIDPTCAGDSFAGGFMAGIARGETVREAVVTASCLAALNVSRQGSMYNCYFDSREQWEHLKIENKNRIRDEIRDL